MLFDVVFEYAFARPVAAKYKILLRVTKER
jgi:hypothetical protein